MRRVLVKMLLVLFTIYKGSFSLFFGPCCRFAPSCSCYALQSIERHGVLSGTWLAIKRIGRCHPFHPGGYDPVPENLTDN